MNSIICLILLLVSLLFYLEINKENYASYGGWRWTKSNKNKKPSESSDNSKSEGEASKSKKKNKGSGSGESKKNESLGIQVKNITPPKRNKEKEEEEKRKKRKEDDRRILSNRCITADNCNIPYQKKLLKIVGQPDTKRWSEYIFEPTETDNYNKNDAKNIANDEVLYSERDLKEYAYDVDQKSRIGIPLRGKLHSQMKKVKKKKGSCLEIQATSDDQLLNEQSFKNKTAIERFKPNVLRTKLWKNSGHVVLNENYVNPFNSKDLSPLKAPLLNNYEKNNAKKPSQFEVISEVNKYYKDKFPKCIDNKNELRSYIDRQIQKKYDENISNEKYFLATAREYREAGSCHKLLKTKEKLKIFSLDNHIMYDEPISNKLKIKHYDSDLSEIHIKMDILTPKIWGSIETNTNQGKECLPWKTARGGKKSHFSKSNDDNTCGDPDGDGFDWCYTSNGPNNYWGKCKQQKSNQFFLALIGKGDYSPEVTTENGCCGLAISLIYQPMLSKNKAILALTNSCNTDDEAKWEILAQEENSLLNNNTRYQIDIYYDTITGLTKIWKNGELAFSTTILGGKIKKGYISLGSGCHSKVFKPWKGKIYKMDIFSGKPSWVDDGAGKPVEGFTSGSSAKKYYDKTISKNRGVPIKNPHGNRRLTPKKAPYEKYLSQLSGKLSNVEFKYHKMSGTKEIKENFKQNKFIKKNTNKFLNAEQNIKKIIKKDKTKILKKTKKKCNVETFTKKNKNSNSKKTKIKKAKKKKIKKAKKINKIEKFNQEIDSNIPQANPINNIEKEEFNKKIFANAEGKKPVVDKPFDFKPKVEFKHEQPEKKIASAYGWSYIPPQYWSVPQKRPPVCIPAAGTEEIVRPLYDKGTPVNALEWNQVGSIIPKFEYKTVYNPNYYYPGWIAQDNVNYPKKGAVSTEYYNNNPATATNPNQGK